MLDFIMQAIGILTFIAIALLIVVVVISSFLSWIKGNDLLDLVATFLCLIVAFVVFIAISTLLEGMYQPSNYLGEIGSVAVSILIALVVGLVVTFGFIALVDHRS